MDAPPPDPCYMCGAPRNHLVNRVPRRSEPAKLDLVLTLLGNINWTIYNLLDTLFTSTSSDPPKKSLMVSHFLEPKNAARSPEVIMEKVFSHPFSGRQGAHGYSKDRLMQWVIEKWVVKKIKSEMAKLVKAQELRVPKNGHEGLAAMVQNFKLEKGEGSVFHKLAPTLFLLLTTAAAKKPRPPEKPLETVYVGGGGQPMEDIENAAGKKKKRRQKREIRDTAQVVSIAMYMLAFARNSKANRFPTMMGAMFFSTTVHQSVYRVASKMGISVSYTTILSILRRLGAGALSMLSLAITNAMGDPLSDQWWSFVYDNINIMQRSFSGALHAGDQLKSGTAVLAIKMGDCKRAAFDKSVLHRTLAAHPRRALTLQKVVGLVDSIHLERVYALHCVRILVDFVPGLSHLIGPVTALWEKDGYAVKRMRKGRKSEFVPLCTSSCDEGSTGGNAEVLEELLINQLKLDPDEISKRLVLIGGDQATIERLRKLKGHLALSDCEHGFPKLDWVVPQIMLWHMGWADLARIMTNHWGDTGADKDSSSIGVIAALLNEAKVDPKRDRPNYYPAERLLRNTFEGTVLAAWTTYLQADQTKTVNLVQHFKDSDTSIDELLAKAKVLVGRYMSSTAAERALSGKRDPFIDGPDGQNHRLYDGTYAGDKTLYNTIVMLRDMATHVEYKHAVAAGDIGRVLKVVYFWVFTFWGSGKSKYGNEILELICNLEYEFSPELVEAFLQNWIVNSTGNDGAWYEMDLLMEHHIFWLKNMAQKKNAEFEGDFYKYVVSPNVDVFLDLKKSMERCFDLATKSSSHSHSDCKPNIKEVLQFVLRRDGMGFQRGRDLGPEHQEQVYLGYSKLQTKVPEYTSRTTKRNHSTNAQPESEESESTPEEPGIPEELAYPPLPGVLVDGGLVIFEQGEVERLEAEVMEPSRNRAEELEAALAVGESESEESSDEE